MYYNLIFHITEKTWKSILILRYLIHFGYYIVNPRLKLPLFLGVFAERDNIEITIRIVVY